MTLTIKTIDGTIFASQEINHLRIPVGDGLLALMSHHAPMVAGLSKGKIEVSLSSGEKKEFICQRGVLKTSKNLTTIYLRD